MAKPILLIDDDQSFREVLRFHLEEEDYRVDTAPDGRKGLALFQQELHPVVLTDLKMPEMDGLALMREVLKRAPQTAVIVITAFGDIETAVSAMKAGAFDFIPKPASREHCKLVVQRAFEHVELKARLRDFEKRRPSEGGELIYKSAAMERVVELAERVAASNSTVLIRGESGTGKEILARRIHLLSERAQKPFVAVNCAALPRDLLESELFGHVKGAFTGAARDHKGKFQQASGGTLFLDEIGELPLDLQPRLLRVLQEHSVDMVGGESPLMVDVRVIAATNRDIEQAIENGTFRQDLYFRLNVVPIEIPPLRQRREDIALLSGHFVARHAKGRKLKFGADLLEALESYDWPGNVRELDNVCQRLVLLEGGQQLGVEQLPDALKAGQPGRAGELAQAAGRDGDIQIAIPPEGASLEELEKQIIVLALRKNGYNRSQTARFLKIPRHVLLYRIAKYKIPTSG